MRKKNGQHSGQSSDAHDEEIMREYASPSVTVKGNKEIEKSCVTGENPSSNKYSGYSTYAEDIPGTEGADQGWSLVVRKTKGSKRGATSRVFTLNRKTKVKNKGSDAKLCTTLTTLQTIRPANN
jgi:hypothetical protein